MSTLAYHCKIQLALQCLITQIKVEAKKIEFNYHKKGQTEQTVTLSIIERNPSATLVAFIWSEKNENFAIMDPKGLLADIPNGDINQTQTFLNNLERLKLERDLQPRKRRSSEYEEETCEVNQNYSEVPLSLKQQPITNYFQKNSKLKTTTV